MGGLEVATGGLWSSGTGGGVFLMQKINAKIIEDTVKAKIIVDTVKAKIIIDKVKAKIVD